MKTPNTDILLEYLIEGSNNSGQADFFFNSASETEICFLNNIVLHEVISSIEENIKFDKSDVLTVLRALLSNSQIRFENREIVKEAIEMYTKGRSGFSDCLKLAVNKKFIPEKVRIARKSQKKIAV